MTKKTWIIGGVVAAFAVVGLFGIALQRGVVYFTGWHPHISMSALTNPQPSLDRPINFPADFPPQAQQIFNANLAKTKAALAKDPREASAWLNLAIDYKMVGDYAGAVEIWKYVSASDPKDPISLHNLGEYYFHTAKDYKTAEIYYLKSIAASPVIEQDYTDLFDLYSVYKPDTAAAPDILKQGIQHVGMPSAIDLMAMLGQYYQTKGDKVGARAYYTQARDAAATYKNTQLVAQLNQQIAQLGK